ncbi:MmcQ/YjbR family DNA-binding protein [Steroidobacter flavus]|uniref:MmcQ/YjbR family DNA-binding protein n=1 Tax=Steroidobacter flavus TaxID=1842136 RepID=A0ABV8SNH8_9GAMM
MSRKPSADKVRTRVAAIVERLPEAKAVRSGEHLSLEVRQRRFGWFLADHHGDGRLALSCKAPPLLVGQLQQLVPEQFHLPKYVASKGWIGLWLDVPKVDWDQVEICLVEAYRMAAPKTLAAQLSG